MEIKRNKVFERKARRWNRFGLLKIVPKRKIFNKSQHYLGLLIISLIVVCIIIARLNSEKSGISLFMGLFVASIYPVAFSIKYIFSLIFPEIILTKKGIKFIDSNLISWDKIKRIEVNSLTYPEKRILITKTNLKVITRKFGSKNFKNLGIYCRSFFKKYRE